MSLRRRSTLAVAAGALAALPTLAAVEGTVITSHNTPVEGARVELVDDGLLGNTDSRGRFRFEDADSPARIRVTHPRFQPLEAECCAEGAPPLTLIPKQEVFEQIVVTANREGSAAVQPVSVATSSISVLDRPAPVSSIAELAELAPGVAENGQGGLFQAYSIRGTGGQRVLTLVAGTRILTERRAGATASFIDPLLLGSLDVVRGPYSSYYGSGALGGVIEALPRRFDETTVDLGWQSEGDANHQMVGFAVGGWSVGLARRAQGSQETPDGLFLPAGFEQVSATLARTWELDNGLELDLLLAPTVGDDIGKPNLRYPSRITVYPEERHLVGRLAIRRPGEWHLDLYGHPNRLDTENVTADERSLVANQAFDFGFNLQRELTLPNAFAARVGLDYFGRRGVQATERVVDLATGATDFSRTLDGRQDDLAAYGSLRRTFGGVSVEAGGRVTWIEQANAGAQTVADTAVTGFLGLTVPVGAGFELATNVGSGFRFPGLSERFFTGSTGRGEVIANQELDPERSLTTDFGVRWFGDRLFVAAYVFRTEVDDYIERIDLDTGVRTFANLTSGTIEGIELEGFFQATETLRIDWTAQTIEGEADDGTPLAESPADRITVSGDWSRDAWGASLRWQHRFEKDDPGPGEVATGEAEIVSAAVAYTLPNGLTLALSGNNLLDDTYLPAADDLAVPAPRRSVGFGVRWGG